jgi:uncharacterized membrane protein YvlD (DUF360 family)
MKARSPQRSSAQDEASRYARCQRDDTMSQRRQRVRQAVGVLLGGAALLWIVISVMPGVSISSGGSVVLATLVVAVTSALLRPALAAVATLLNWIGVVLVGLFAQALIFYAALSLTPDVTVTGFWPAFWASWLYALLISAIGWVFDANDDELFVRDILRHRSVSTTSTRTLAPGVVIVQIDGLSAPLLQWAVQAGELPTISRWLRTGSHQLTPWRAQLPPTTPASQAGILHGRSDAVPAFRWYDKKSGRLTVTNHPDDARDVERGMSDGTGLLADGGASIGNIFSGDADHRLLTMSAGRGHGPSRQFATSYLRPFGFTRSLLLTLGEMVKEIHQGHRQSAHGITPRIDRRTSYIALRGVTNVLLRDLNVRLLAEQMLAGTPVMYCDFTDYDEVAHHAGPTRPESVASLAGVDRALAVLERIAAAASRPYEFVVLSDHGQSQGATFRQRYGEPLEAVVRRLMTRSREATATAAPAGRTVTVTDRDEEWGPVGSLLTQVGAGRGATARVSRHVTRRHEAGHAEVTEPSTTELIVTGSGNLAFVYFPRHRDRLTWEELDGLYPGLVTGLAAHDGVGFVVVVTAARGAVAVGRSGVHFVDQGVVRGEDPLQPFGPSAANEVRRHAQLAHVGDLVVNSRIDAATSEVAAFEELVGSHGGLGGWQSEAALVHPCRWETPDPLVGADQVHAQLVRWLEDLGQRRRIRRSPPLTVSARPAADSP